jgi:adenine/guanine phosphoribosyltransferase-like PRPP-binding protein
MSIHRELQTQTGYLHAVLTSPAGLKSTVRECLDVLTDANYLGTGAPPISDSFDAIAFSGNSGAMVAPLLAMQLDKYLVLVRKPHDGGHSTDAVEGVVEPNFRYIIVDDCVCSGATAVRIQCQILRRSPGAECVGLLAYNDRRFSDVANMKVCKCYFDQAEQEEKAAARDARVAALGFGEFTNPLPEELVYVPVPAPPWDCTSPFLTF